MHDKLFSRPWWRKHLFKLISKLIKRGAGTKESLPRNPGKILVLAPVLRGDYIVLSPLLSGFTKVCPKSELSVVVSRTCLDLAAVDTTVDRLFVYEKSSRWLSSVIKIWKYKPDIVVLPKGHPAFTESFLLLVSRAPIRVGLSHPHHDALLTHAVEHEKEMEHRTLSYVRLLQEFGADISSINRRPHIGINERSERMANAAFNGWPSGKPWIGINLSAGHPSRVWPISKWKELLERVQIEVPSAKFVVLAGPGDFLQARYLAGELKNAFTIPTKTMLDVSALVAKTSLVISPDTGTMHVAVARNVPVVVLYNSDRENYIRFAPLSVPHRAIHAEEGKEVKDLAVDEVYREMMLLLAECDSK